MRNLLQHSVRLKARHIVRKDRRARKPLTVEFSPHRFRPARFGYRQMQTVVHDILPILRRNNVSERIYEIVLNHFRITRRTRRKIQQHDIFVARRFVARRPVKARIVFFNLFMKVHPYAALLSDGYERLYRRRSCKRFFNLFLHFRFVE